MSTELAVFFMPACVVPMAAPAGSGGVGARLLPYAVAAAAAGGVGGGGGIMLLLLLLLPGVFVMIGGIGGDGGNEVGT